MRDSVRLSGRALLPGASFGALIGLVEALLLLRTEVRIAVPSAALWFVSMGVLLYATFGGMLALAVSVVCLALKRSRWPLALVPAVLVSYSICAIGHYTLRQPVRSGGFAVVVVIAALAFFAVRWILHRTALGSGAGPRLRSYSRLWLLFSGAAVTAVVFAAKGLVAPSASLSTSAPETRPNVVLLTIDTLRADRVGAYGYAMATTPNLDRLASAGATFLHAYTPVVQTGPAHAALLTSGHTVDHRLGYNGERIHSDIPTLAELLHAEGYRTFAAVSGSPLDGYVSSLDRGFQRFSDTGRLNTLTAFSLLRIVSRLYGPNFWKSFRAGSRAVDDFEDWLGAAHRQAFFAWIHIFDPHSPYGDGDAKDPSREDALRAEALKPEAGPNGAAAARLSRLYDGGVTSSDREVGRVLAALATLDLLEDTFVIVASDHGETLADLPVDRRFWFTHQDVYESAARVVLTMTYPVKIPHGLAVDTPVSLLDVVPTVLSLVGIQNGNRHFRGIDLTPVFAGLEADQQRSCIVVQHGPNTPSLNSWAVRTDCWKLVLRTPAGPAELYDVCKDPGEASDLAAKYPGVTAKLHTCFRAHRRFYGGTASRRGSLIEEQLRSLGY